MSPFDIDLVPLDTDAVTKVDYWFINIKGVEWLYIISKMIKDRKIDQVAPSKKALLTGLQEDAIMYIVKREFLPASVLIKATGRSLEWLEKQDMIKLRVKEVPGLPAPTVSGWGTA